jgi:hypothetical protein
MKRFTTKLLTVLSLLLAVAGFAQTFKSGVKQGVLKVKFKAEQTATLSKTKISARSSGFISGMANVDRVAQRTKASNMYRLFPYDARHEHKLQKHGLHLWYVVDLDNATDPNQAVALFKQLGEVAVAEVEHEKVIAPYQVVPHTPTASTFNVLPFNDPLLKDQWHYNNTGQSGYSGYDVNLFSAWTTVTGSSNIIVSVHDQGVDVNHPDLKANMWVNIAERDGATGVDDDGNGYIDDINGYNFEKNKGAVDPQHHGTHVAGTVAAVNNNGLGVSGVAGGNGTGNGARIMSLQILGGAPIEKSYVYAANNGAVISQNSWGYTSPYYFDQSVKDAIDYFIEEAGDFDGSPMKGGLVIFAAGNSNSADQWYPGYYDKTLAVASLGPEGIRAPYSNYGEWVDIAAPGGDQFLNGRSGVLSTIPQGQYAYLQGTSMACPHVSGIAALALANRTKQLTNTELWNKLVTGVIDVEASNPDFVGKLGSGAINAAMAIQNDQGIAPASIQDLLVIGVAQEFATLTWTVPTDEDDAKPVSFQLYYHTQPITSANLTSATKINIANQTAATEYFSYEVSGLLGLTEYHFVVTSTDRWGNVSTLSNAVTAQTNEGPAIAVDENSQSINLSIDVTNSNTATHDINILNNAAGILRWNYFFRHTNTAVSFNASHLRYPVASKRSTTQEVGRQLTHADNNALKSNEPVAMAYTPVEKSLSDWPTNIIGETNLSLTNSAAGRFSVTEPTGFNLTHVRMYLKHDAAKGPVIMEIYKGDSPSKANLVYAQEHVNYGTTDMWANIALTEQLYFENGSTFWIVFHVPAGNLYPLGIGFESDPANSTQCFMSFDLGNKWVPLEEAINSKSFAWSMIASSLNPYLGQYLTLEPGSGDVQGHEQVMATLTANGETLINGNYSANLVIASNDAMTRELRIPVNLTVTGQQPDIRHIDIADFGAVFVGTEKVLELTLDNVGYGNFNDPVYSFSGDQFTIDGSGPWRIAAREQQLIKIKFKPTATGSMNDILTISNGNHTYQVVLSGIGAEASKLELLPAVQTVNNIAIGDVVNAQVTVQNTGAFPLKYFVPGFDTKGVGNNWPTRYHKYGYKLRSNKAGEVNPIAYEYQNIATTGIDVTSQLPDYRRYVEIPLDFEFPYYGQKMTKIYLAKNGFTTFDNTVQPINLPVLDNSYSPRGYISVLGTFISLLSQGQIFYQQEADRLIIQFDNVTDGWSGESITAQMVIHANGDIRFYYENMGFSIENQSFLNVLMEDMDRQDGILVSRYDKPYTYYSGLALGFDYPGPDIITSVSNASGIVMPGNSVTMDVALSTSSLSEGLTNRYINVISNDPAQGQASALIQLNVVSGGLSKPVVLNDTIAFGDVFQGDVQSATFTVKNPGTANINVTSITKVNNKFTLSGAVPALVKPGLYKTFTVSIPTTQLGQREDWLSINYADGTHDTVYVTGRVVVPPAIQVDLSPLSRTLTYGETTSIPFNIKNTGLANLEVAATGKQWLSYDAPVAPTSVTYAFEKHNTGGVYQWIDIRNTGTQLPFVNWEDESTFWRTLTLPFPIEFYGQTHTSMKIGDNGIITFEEDPAFSFFVDDIPTSMHAGPCIMPYWTFSTFSDYLYEKEDIGIFHQTFDDKFIITWSFFVNNFGGMGDPVSAQVIFYRNGTMKFQYKVEEGGLDLTSQASSIGVQLNATTGVAISNLNAIDHGQGLAYTLVPVKTMSVAPGETLAGAINLDARNVYGGVYNEILKINTNVPSKQNLQKPVELTVLGEAMLSTPAVVDFEEKIVAFDFFGTPNTNYLPANITNTGTAPMTIDWMQMADATQNLSIQLYTLVDGWFGAEWKWVDIAELYSPWAWNPPVFQIMPGDKLNARAVFSPNAAGEFMDDVVLTTSIGEKRFTLKGIGVEPPILEVDETPVDVMMNTLTETADRSIAFNNTNGKSNLSYTVSIDYGRAGATNKESMLTQPAAATQLQIKKTNGLPVARAMETYNRVLRHTNKETADNHVGTGGSAPFTIATRYNAGIDGFNLSHVEAWFRLETVTSGTIEVEVRAGGSSIASAQVIGQGKLNFTGSGADENGGWRTIALEEAVAIYPNEDFYVAITYPLGIEYPQGTITGEPATPNRYFYFDEGSWGDLQAVGDFASAGWLMYAAEKTAGAGTWLSITSATEGDLATGESGAVQLQFTGVRAKRGDQVAHIVFQSNDPANPEKRVPVILRVNDAPMFTQVPDDISISEGESLALEITVTDLEGHTFTVAPKQNYTGVSHTLNNGLLKVNLTYNYGDEGIYDYIFLATDQYQASREMKLNVQVAHKNRAPQWIADSKEMEFNASGRLMEFNITDFYNDPDDDEFTFQVASSNHESVEVFASLQNFIIRPKTVGQADVIFIATDSFGSVSRDTVQVTVNVILGLEPGANTLEVYPNPTASVIQIATPVSWKGEATFQFTDGTGREHFTTAAMVSPDANVQLNVSSLPAGMYLMRASYKGKQIIQKVIKK